MFPINSAIQERRGAKTNSLAIGAHKSHVSSAQGEPLPPLKSPRGHLLDRIRSTPRTSGFVPQSAPPAPGVPTDNNSVYPDGRAQSSSIGESRNGPPQTRSKPFDRGCASTGHEWQRRPDPASADQMVMLEQRLKAQNDLLVQQQMLLQHLQQQRVQQHTEQQFYSPGYYASPPYSPQSDGNGSVVSSSAYNQTDSNSMHNVVYDVTTGQYYMLGPQHMNKLAVQPNFAYNVTPPHKSQQQTNNFTPESLPRTTPVQSRNSPPPKEGHPSRQPKGPPAIELLAADSAIQLNFSARTRKRSAKVLEAGLFRRRASPGLQEDPRSLSRGSTRSNHSLGPIEEAFPAIEIV